MVVVSGGMTVTVGHVNIAAGDVNILTGGLSVHNGIRVATAGVDVEAGGLTVHDGMVGAEERRAGKGGVGVGRCRRTVYHGNVNIDEGGRSVQKVIGVATAGVDEGDGGLTVQDGTDR